MNVSWAKSSASASEPVMRLAKRVNHTLVLCDQRLKASWSPCWLWIIRLRSSSVATMRPYLYLFRQLPARILWVFWPLALYYVLAIAVQTGVEIGDQRLITSRQTD